MRRTEANRRVVKNIKAFEFIFVDKMLFRNHTKVLGRMVKLLGFLNIIYKYNAGWSSTEKRKGV